MTDPLISLKTALRQFDASQLPISKVAQEFVLFFEHVETLLRKMSAREKGKVSEWFAELSQKLLQLITPYIEAVALDEELLLTLIDQPHHFNEEQWKSVQEAKQLIAIVSSRMAPLIFPSQTTEKTTPTEKNSPSSSPRSRWMKS